MKGRPLRRASGGRSVACRQPDSAAERRGSRRVNGRRDQARFHRQPPIECRVGLAAGAGSNAGTDRGLSAGCGLRPGRSAVRISNEVTPTMIGCESSNPATSGDCLRRGQQHEDIVQSGAEPHDDQDDPRHDHHLPRVDAGLALTTLSGLLETTVRGTHPVWQDCMTNITQVNRVRRRVTTNYRKCGATISTFLRWRCRAGSAQPRGGATSFGPTVGWTDVAAPRLYRKLRAIWAYGTRPSAR